MIFVITCTWCFTDPTLLAPLAVMKLIIDEEIEVGREKHETGIYGIVELSMTGRAKRNGIGG